MKKVELQIIDNVYMKNCTHCGRLLSIDNFSKSKSSAHGYRSWCKYCINISRNSEENKLKCKEYYNSRGRELTKLKKENNIQKYLYDSAKARAKSRNEEFSINISDIIVPELCPILGIKMYYHRGIKHDDSYSLDRIDSNKGYTKENIWVISLRANRIKNDSNPNELRVIADAVEKQLKNIQLSI